MPTTIAEVWSEAAAAGSDARAFLVETPAGWEPLTWAEADARVRALADGFQALGLRKGDRVAILGRTRVEWTLCDYALASLGVVTVPIYHSGSREDCAHIVRDSGARVLVCEDAAQAEKTAGFENEIPKLERRLVMDPVVGLESLGELVARRPVAASERAAVVPEDLLTFIYTSGTTGPPKGCVLTHANFVAELEAIRQIEGLFLPGDTVLVFLPLAHNFARLIQYCGARLGLTIAFCAEPSRLPHALRAVRPTTVPGVPRVFEKMHGTVRGAFAAESPRKQRVVAWALRVGARAAARRARGQRLAPGLAVQVALADRLVFARVKARLGGRLRVAISGGAPLAREVGEFFAACGILILEGYGLSETTSGCAVNRPAAHRFGTVGLPLPGVEIAIAPDGEVMVRGETLFSGYHGRMEETAAAFAEDGWLLTGDIGEIDADGFLSITDRKKELIVTAGGKKVAPQPLENALKASPPIADVLVVGEGRPYLGALVVVDTDAIPLGDAGGADVERRVGEAVERVNARLGRTDHIKRFAILPRPFSADAGEITPTLKLRRRVCEEHFRAEIDALYGSAR